MWYRGFSCGRALAPECLGSAVAARQLSCPEACGILVPQPWIKLVSSPLEGRFLTTGPPGKSPERLFFFFFKGQLREGKFAEYVIGLCTILGLVDGVVTGWYHRC